MDMGGSVRCKLGGRVGGHGVPARAQHQHFALLPGVRKVYCCVHSALIAIDDDKVVPGYLSP
eukprot:CAMPEP_0194268674 /NCGR_PEP_ID=MMETSP0169-20130528/2949_1 /TAXON_ID=218684 /ORGANISM="Corethron pennatum, Strain L29A3" /LENGTH=61 /DNA_ID=CAMNT_0039009985 /DNA_START=321 /DNA_END=506 /DNA_ORIENTATION=-